jgi:chloride channel 3/4/5
MVHQYFTKLGARYVVVTDTDGLCACRIWRLILIFCAETLTDEGVIDKKTWLAFLSELEEK